MLYIIINMVTKNSLGKNSPMRTGGEKGKNFLQVKNFSYIMVTYCLNNGS